MANIKAEISLKDSEAFKNALSIISDVLHDERISKNLRAEYDHKCNQLLSPANKNVIIENIETKQDMTERKTVNEFKETGLIWFINTILHTFGWAIAYEPGKNFLYPVRCKFRGFDEKSNDEGYTKVSKYMKDNAEKLLKECED